MIKLFFLVVLSVARGVTATVAATVNDDTTNLNNSTIHGNLRQGQRRKLPRIQGLGGEPDASLFPLHLCQGDCDNDNECAPGLVCFQKDAYTAVPGCLGGEDDSSLTDYCVLESGFNPIPTTTIPTTTRQAATDNNMLVFLGNDGFPSSVFPLPRCAGDCDSDGDCDGNLICFQRNRFDDVPGCNGGSADATRTDYCVLPANAPNLTPTATTRPSPRPSARPSTMQPAPTQDLPVPTSAGTQTIRYIGNNGSPASAFPLGACQGDCDSDADCAGNLVCHQRGTFEAVPTCLGGNQDSSQTDYCISLSTPEPTTPNPTSKPTAMPTSLPTPLPTPLPTNLPTPAPRTIQYIGNNGDPSEIFPLDRCQGDCDSDSECLPGLICYQRVAFEAVPGCFGAEQDSSRTDYCILPPVATFMPVTTPAPVSGTITARPTARPTQNQSPKMVRVVGDNGSPSNVFPLGICEGDCDDDDDCAWGLYCHQRGRNDGVPGCLGGESDRSSKDYCAPLPADKAPLPGSFRLKVYWEEGYLWQEEDFERKWCATFDYEGTCWYGLETGSCRSDQIYLSKCDNDYRQSFLFEKLDNDEVLIKLGNRENKCWTRSSRSIYLRSCDPTDRLQRWFAPNGSFDGPRFEISQKGFESQCVANDHHPKAGEVIEMHFCQALRKPDSQTSYWNKY